MYPPARACWPRITRLKVSQPTALNVVNPPSTPVTANAHAVVSGATVRAARPISRQPRTLTIRVAHDHVAGRCGEPIVSEVLRSGYTWKGRILRAAMVKTKD